MLASNAFLSVKVKTRDPPACARYSPFLHRDTTNESSCSHEKGGKGPHLSVGILVNFIVPRVVIVINKSKIFFLFSLESGRSSVHVGRKVTLGAEEKKDTWLLMIRGGPPGEVGVKGSHLKRALALKSDGGGGGG